MDRLKSQNKLYHEQKWQTQGNLQRETPVIPKATSTEILRENLPGSSRTTKLETPRTKTLETPRETTLTTPETSYAPRKINIFHQTLILVLQSLIYWGHQIL